MKNTLLFCTGLSGSGKTYFIENTLPNGLFYNLRSATTRPMRAGESDGNPYFFRDEAYFDTARLCTHLWVNERFWTDGMPKWLYGVPEDEVYNNLGKNLIYDVIEPRYVRQMLDWFRQNKLAAQYNFRVAYFLSPEQNLETARARANMPNDADVRRTNTCDPIDFLRAGLDIDYILSPRNGLYNPRLAAHVKYLQKAR
ncbi:MAG: hypothetical protein IJX43_03955 [Alphaproteobacteria bacterium]|nr:hypothetical protein [Alphaproteobacteria bacterium]